MTLKKRIIATALVLSLALGIGIFYAESKNRNDDNTLKINLLISNAPQIMEALETKFPDINFVYNVYAGANFSGYQKEQLIRGKGGDIFFYTTFFNSDNVKDYLVDLSGYSFLANFDKSILSTLDINGAIYQIPGPITVRYIGVNKTLFEEKGWKIPENFEETVAVCKQIHKEEPEITPLGLGTSGMGFTWSLVTSYTQMGFLDTSEGRSAEEKFLNGTGSFGDAFEEGLDMVGQLVDAGAFKPDRFTNTWDVSPEQMCNREAAMCYIMGPNEVHTKLFSGESRGDSELGKYCNDEFVVRPLFGKNAKNKGLILGATNTWGISKYLEEKGNEKKFANAMRVLEYISTPEGQLATRYDPAAIPAIKNIQCTDIPEYIRNLWNDSTNSIKSFFLYTGYEHLMIDTAQVLIDAMRACSSVGMKEKFVSLADKLNREFLENKNSSGAYGFAQDDLSVEQTRKICCDAFCDTADAQIAISSEGGLKNGVSNKNGLAGQLFKGDIIGERITTIVFSVRSNIVSVNLTGKEIKDMLKNGKIIKDTEGKEASFTYWSSSGIEVSEDDGEATEFMINGKPLLDEETYKVAMINGDYSEEFAENHKIADTEISILESLQNYFKKQGTIRAEN